MDASNSLRDRLAGELPRIRGVVAGVTRPDQIDDVTQECCVRILQKEGLWSGRPGTLAAWIRTVSRNVAFRWLSRRASVPLVEDPPEKPREGPVSAEQVRWVLEGMAELTEPQRDVLRLHYYEGLKIVEIAGRLGINPQSVSNRLSNAITTLRTRARRDGQFASFAMWGGAFMSAKIKVAGAVVVALVIGAIGGRIAGGRPDLRTSAMAASLPGTSEISWEKKAAALQRENERLRRSSGIEPPSVLPGTNAAGVVPTEPNALGPERRAALEKTLAWLKKLSAKEFGAMTVEDLATAKYIPLFCLALKGEDLRQLGRLPALESINLSGSSFTRRELEAIQDLALKDLHLNHTDLADASFVAIQRIRSLENLYMADAGAVTDDGIAMLHGLSLKDLMLTASKITDRGVAGLPRSLESLNLSRTAGITDSALSELGQFSSLKSLALGATSITGAGLSRLSDLRLEEIDLSHVALDDAALLHLAPMTGLKRISLSGTNVTDSCLLSLGNFAALESLDLRGTKVSAAAIQAFQTAHPDIRVMK